MAWIEIIPAGAGLWCDVCGKENAEWMEGNNGICTECMREKLSYLEGKQCSKV